jgi:phospholipase/carboxylesterase
MAEDNEPLLDATTALLPALLTALDALSYAGRHIHPPSLEALVGEMAPFRAPLEEVLTRFQTANWPAHLTFFRDQTIAASEHVLDALDALAFSLSRSNPMLGAYGAIGKQTLALEALYPVTAMLGPVSRHFLSPPHRDDPELQARLASANAARAEVGVRHAANAAAERGGFSIYVPEYYRPDQPLPLVVALHGGSGHGRSFLWTWLRDARSRGAILVAPTSRGGTWSLQGPDVDTANLHAIVEHVRGLWAVDESRMLLTGMSDGATFSLLTGLHAGSPFSHLAPVSGTFHPLLLSGADFERLQNLPVYLVHGSLDWMFPVDVAQMARDALSAAGASVIYRELADLSHTYPREENDLILDWLLDGAVR